MLSSADWLAAQPGHTEFAAAAADQVRRASLSGSSGDEDEDGFGGPKPPAPPLASSSVDGPRTAVEALDVAHRTTLQPGSSTACVVRLAPSSGSGKALLDAANLGDSGFLIVRDGRLHFQSPAMQHFFDCPLQVGGGCTWKIQLCGGACRQCMCVLGWRWVVGCCQRSAHVRPVCHVSLPPAHGAVQFGMPPDTDWARDAAVYQIEVRGWLAAISCPACRLACLTCRRVLAGACAGVPLDAPARAHLPAPPCWHDEQVLPGDVLVLATDGLLDNLFPEDIVALAPRSPGEVEQVRRLQGAGCIRGRGGKCW